MDAIEATSKKVVGGLAALGAAGTAAGTAMAVAAVKLAASMEQSRIAFTTMLGSGEKANTFLRELADFAAKTPFSFRGLQESSKQLLAMGFSAEQILPTLTGVGNAVAALGGGEDTIAGITRALGQMQAKGKVSAEEMMQLAERGIPAWQILAEAIGTDIPKAMKLAEKGAIPAAAAIQALVEGMNRRFPEMMAKQSDTLLGQWANAQDKVEQMLTRLGEKFTEALDLRSAVAAATDMLLSLEGPISQVGVWLRQAIESLIKLQAIRDFFVQGKGVVAPGLTPEQQAAFDRFDATSWGGRGGSGGAMGRSGITLPGTDGFSYVDNLLGKWKDLNFEVASFGPTLDELKPKIDGNKSSLFGLADSADKAKTALELFGINIDLVRTIGADLGLTQAEIDAQILAFGGTVLDTGAILEGYGVTLNRVAAAYNAIGRDGNAVASQLQEIAAGRRAEAEAEKAAAEAKRQAAAAEAELRRQREAAMNRSVGAAMAGILWSRSGGTSAGDFVSRLRDATSGIEDMAKAQMDLAIPLAAINQALGELGMRFATLSGSDLASAGAVMDGLTALLGQLMTGEIQIDEFRNGVQALSGELSILAAKVDENTEKQRQLAEATRQSAEAAIFAQQEWEGWRAAEIGRIADENARLDAISKQRAVDRAKEAAEQQVRLEAQKWQRIASIEEAAAARRRAREERERMRYAEGRLWGIANSRIENRLAAVAGTGTPSGKLQELIDTMRALLTRDAKIEINGRLAGMAMNAAGIRDAITSYQMGGGAVAY